MVIIKQNESVNVVIRKIREELSMMSNLAVEAVKKQEEKEEIGKQKEASIKKFEEEFVPIVTNALQEVEEIQKEIKKLQKQKRDIETAVKSEYHKHISRDSYYSGVPSLKMMVKKGKIILENIKVTREQIEKRDKIRNYFGSIANSVNEVVTNEKEESITNIIEVLKAYNIDFEYIKEKENNQLAKEMLLKIFNN